MLVGSFKTSYFCHGILRYLQSGKYERWISFFSPNWQATMSHFQSACVGLHVQLGCVHSNCICSSVLVTGLHTFYSCRKAELWGQSWPLFTFVVTVVFRLSLTSEGKKGDALHSHICWAEFEINHRVFFRRMRDVRLNRSDTSSRMSSYKVQRSRESLEEKKKSCGIHSSTLFIILKFLFSTWVLLYIQVGTEVQKTS